MTDITALRAIWTVGPQPQPWPDFAQRSRELRLGTPHHPGSRLRLHGRHPEGRQGI